MRGRRDSGVSRTVTSRKDNGVLKNLLSVRAWTRIGDTFLALGRFQVSQEEKVYLRRKVQLEGSAKESATMGGSSDSYSLKRRVTLEVQGQRRVEKKKVQRFIDQESSGLLRKKRGGMLAQVKNG